MVFPSLYCHKPKKAWQNMSGIWLCSKVHGTSLNENVLQDPDLTNSLFGVVIRFGQETIALIADIEAMFHQVCVDSKDVDVLRFLWISNGDLTQQPDAHQMMVHFLVRYGPRAARPVHWKELQVATSWNLNLSLQFYIDDLLKSVKGCKNAIRMYGKL